MLTGLKLNVNEVVCPGGSSCSLGITRKASEATVNKCLDIHCKPEIISFTHSANIISILPVTQQQQSDPWVWFVMLTSWKYTTAHSGCIHYTMCVYIILYILWSTLLSESWLGTQYPNFSTSESILTWGTADCECCVVQTQKCELQNSSLPWKK